MRSKNSIFYVLMPVLLLGPFFAHAQGGYILFNPSSVYQGEPVMIQITASSTSVKNITFGGKPVAIFKYKNKPTGIVGIDLNKAPGLYFVTAELSNGDVIYNTLEVKQKPTDIEKYTIPDKLGGGTIQSQKELIVTLAEENSIFKNVKTGKKIWWLDGFKAPLQKTEIGDKFGYYRNLGNMIMAHKGVDYVASEGTKVMATNDGIVRLVGEYRNYGKTIIVDHGLGVLSFYLHLSETDVKQGEFVYAGQVIGLSGETGYADAPHLHFSIRVYGVSVDPVKFLELFK